jgi:hypothetical protein
VDQIIQALEDTSFLPAAARGTADAELYGSAKDIARNIANMMGATDKEKSPTTVTVSLSKAYCKAADLRAIFDRIADLVKKIAAATPGGAAKVADVILTPATSPDDKTLPIRRIIHLH